MSLTRSRIFAGSYTHSLDSKNRVTVPKKWRFDGDQEESAYLAIPHPAGYIWMCPPSKVAQIEVALESIKPSDLEAQNFAMHLMSNSDMVYCDKSGRVVLSPKLLEHAQIEEQPQLIGTFGSWAIWNSDRYEKFSSDHRSLDIDANGQRMLAVMDKIWST